MLHQVWGFSWMVAESDGVVGASFLFLSMWSIALLIRSYPTKVTIVAYAMVLAAAAAVVSVYGSSAVLLWWLKEQRNLQYNAWLHNSLQIRLFFYWLFYSWVATNLALRKNINELNTRFQQQADASALHREAELFKLRQQLQPHFLYNSLNSISALIMIAPEKGQEMIGRLSDFLRGSVKRESEDAVPVDEELAYIESYLAIESVRFGDRLQVVLERDCHIDATIPPFLFQPILENAIKFGLYGKTGEVKITVSIQSDYEMLILKITNPYDANGEPPRGTGFGLTGIARRLYLLYARTDLLETIKDDQYFTTILKIPQLHV